MEGDLLCSFVCALSIEHPTRKRIRSRVLADVWRPVYLAAWFRNVQTVNRGVLWRTNDEINS